MTVTAIELAERLGLQLEGDTHARISGIAAPGSAGPEDLIYVDGPRHLESAQRSAAVCVVTAPDTRIPGKTLLLHTQPKLAFARIAAILQAPRAIASGIHATAIVDASARLGAGVAVGPYAVVEASAAIGAGTQVGAFCFVGAGCAIGKDCRLHPRVTLYPGVRLGDRVVAHSGAVLGSDGFGYVFGEGRFWPFPQVGELHIADDVEIGANSTIDRGSLGITQIGAGTKLDNLVHVAHNVQIGEHTVIAAQTGISGSSRVGNHVLVGGQVGIAERCEIQDGAILGAQAGIPTGKTIRAKQTVWGTPARPLEKFKEQYALFSRLPGLAERVRKLEQAK
jgi:UDP-3-O-[3-hydroxymyristoyl] glucosamine N-acyltransferase